MNVKKIAGGIAASVAVAGTSALVAPATAAAAPPPPWTGVHQSGNNVTVDMHGPEWSACTASAIELTKAADVINDPQRVIDGGQGVYPIVGTAPWPAKNPNSGTRHLPNGVYVIAASCIDGGGISRPTVQPILVPEGLDGVIALLDYGAQLAGNPGELDAVVRAIEIFF